MPTLERTAQAEEDLNPLSARFSYGPRAEPAPSGSQPTVEPSSQSPFLRACIGERV